MDTFLKKIFFVLSILLLFYGCRNNTGNAPYMNVPEAKDVVMYEVNPRVFAEKNSLNVVTGRLDEIKALGVNVIWLMPIYEQGIERAKNEDGSGSPYCIKNYKKIASEYGSLEDLQNLVRKAHEKGMAVILDWVGNHTSWDNQWIIDHPEWYTHNEAGEIIHPAPTDWTDVADLNFANHNMRAAMLDAMKYWFTAANIDGYRFDALDFIPETDFLQKMTSELRKFNKGRRILLLSEGAEQDYHSLGFDMDYGWAFYEHTKELYKGTKSIAEFSEKYKEEKNAIPAGKSRLYFTTNHDKSAWEKTDVQLFGSQPAAISAFVLTATLAGAPLIYSTQEIGREEQVPFFSHTQIDWNSAVLDEYKQIMAAYISTGAFTGDELEIFSGNPDIVYFTRSNGTDKVFVAVNIRNEEKTLTLPVSLIGKNAKNLISGTTGILRESIDFQPYQYHLWKLE